MIASFKETTVMHRTLELDWPIMSYIQTQNIYHRSLAFVFLCIKLPCKILVE